MSVPFPFARRAADFDGELTVFIGAELERIRDATIPVENTQRFSHGRRWATKPGLGGDDSGEMETHGFEFETRFEDIVAHRLGIIAEFRAEITEKMKRQFYGSLYETVQRSTAASGNVVDMTAEMSPAQAFLEVLRKIEFAVGRDGNVSLPEFHLHPDAAQKLFESVAAQPPEFHAELERVKAEKTRIALDREQERLAKFMSDEADR